MDSHQLTQDIEAPNGISKPWLLGLLYLNQVAERPYIPALLILGMKKVLDA